MIAQTYLDPFESGHHIVQASVALGVFGAAVKKAERSQAIIDGDHNHIANGHNVTSIVGNREGCSSFLVSKFNLI